MTKDDGRVVFLEGRRAYLRPPQESDIPLLLRWFNDPGVRKFLGRLYPMTEAQEKKFIMRTFDEARNNLVFIIVLKGASPERDRPIGTMGLHQIEWHNGVATTGAAIGEKSCWEKGYGTEAKMLMLEYAFNALNLRKIYSRVLATNHRSNAYSKKCGYTHVATLPERHFRDGRYVDEHILEVRAETWRALWERSRKKFLPK
ncbi:MAG TPA: GNAT family protein [Candidatus Paceibacterota bacterium]|nr:GNAT family protein [Candidatus Paceibacterota bacterium]